MVHQSALCLLAACLSFQKPSDNPLKGSFDKQLWHTVFKRIIMLRCGDIHIYGSGDINGIAVMKGLFDNVSCNLQLGDHYVHTCEIFCEQI